MRLALSVTIALAGSLGLAPLALAQSGNGLYEPFPDGIRKDRAVLFVERLGLGEGPRYTVTDLERGEFLDGAGAESLSAGGDVGVATSGSLGRGRRGRAGALALAARRGAAGDGASGRTATESACGGGLGARSPARSRWRRASARSRSPPAARTSSPSRGSRPRRPGSSGWSRRTPSASRAATGATTSVACARRAPGSCARPSTGLESSARPGAYDLSFYDRFVADLTQRGLRVLPIVFNPPPFRSSAPAGARRRGTYPPARPGDMGRFAAVLARRYGPGGSIWRENPKLPFRPIRSWQIWNEPNLPVYWPTGPDPAAYVRLLRATGRAIERVDPKAEIVMAGLPESALGTPPARYLEGVYAAGGADAFDALALHTFGGTAEDVLAAARAARRVAAASGDDPALWITELGWATGGPPSEFRVSEAEQAGLLDSTLRALARRRQDLRLRGVVYFNWRDSLPYAGGTRLLRPAHRAREPGRPAQARARRLPRRRANAGAAAQGFVAGSREPLYLGGDAAPPPSGRGSGPGRAHSRRDGARIRRPALEADLRREGHPLRRSSPADRAELRRPLALAPALAGLSRDAARPPGCATPRGSSSTSARREADATARLLAANGFRRARVELGWNGISYDDPTRLANPAGLRTKLDALRRYGIRPLILLNAHHGGPTPSARSPPTLVEPAARGARRVRVRRSDDRADRPGPERPRAEWRTAGATCCSPRSTPTASPSSPVRCRPIWRPAGIPPSTLRYEPFARPRLADGSANPEFEETLGAGSTTWGPSPARSKQVARQRRLRRRDLERAVLRLGLPRRRQLLRPAGRPDLCRRSSTRRPASSPTGALERAAASRAADSRGDERRDVHERRAPRRAPALVTGDQNSSAGYVGRLDRGARTTPALDRADRLSLEAWVRRDVQRRQPDDPRQGQRGVRAVAHGRPADAAEVERGQHRASRPSRSRRTAPGTTWSPPRTAATCTCTSTART